MDFKNISIRGLAIFLCDHLANQGIEIVLSGGACVSIYTKNEFLSYDLDFVLINTSHKKRIRKIFEEMGFKPEGRHFRHRDTPFIVEFLSPPLSVGEEPVKKIQIIEENERKLKLLSPTDCVKDRLAAYYHWNDRPSLEQAVLVSLAQSVDFKEIERWSSNEGMAAKYATFLEELKRTRPSTGNINHDKIDV
jgi:hypothetical protein